MKAKNATLELLKGVAARAEVYLKARRHTKRKLFETLASDIWDSSVDNKGHMIFGGCDVTELAHHYGTPLHIVNLERLKQNYYIFRDSFADLYKRSNVYLSYKTNPVPGLLKVLHEGGAGAEVISHFELWLALKLGVMPSRIIFNGPYKTEKALKLAVRKGIKLINIDALDEIARCERAASTTGSKQNVGVRLITSVGWASQFGLKIATGEAFQCFKQLKKAENLNPCGIHLHLGTGIKNLDIYLRAIREVLQFCRLLEQKLDICIKYFDFGGGFPVPSVKKFDMLDEKLQSMGFPPIQPQLSLTPSYRSYATKITGLLRDFYPDFGTNGAELVFEPGRAVLSSAQTFVVTVGTVKNNTAGNPVVITDGGRNIAIPLSWEYHEVFAANRMHEDRSVIHSIYGPLCHPSDILFRAVPLPKLQAGDILAIMDAGAYFIPNSRNFSFPRPPVVMVSEGNHWLIRQKEQFDDIVRLDREWCHELAE